MTDAELLAAIAEGRIDALRTVVVGRPWCRSPSANWLELGYETTIMGANQEGFPAMAIEIHDPQAERLAEEVAELTGEPLEIAVLNALRERLERVHLGHELDELVVEVAGRPVLDARSPDQINALREDGLP